MTIYYAPRLTRGRCAITGYMLIYAGRIRCATLNELSKLTEQLSKQQADVDGLKGQLREQKHKFVAQQLLKDSLDMVKTLEAKMESNTEAASPLVSEQKEDSVAAL